MFIENDSILAPDHARHPRPPTAPVPLAGELPVTAPAHQALRHELAKLRQEKAQFADQLRLVREFGDTANNDEYLAIREEEAVVDARLARLEDIVDRARVVDPAESADTIAIGFEYVIDGAHAPVVPGAVSAVSPVGKALLGRRPGEIVTVEVPGKGRMRELEIEAVRALEGP